MKTMDRRRMLKVSMLSLLTAAGCAHHENRPLPTPSTGSTQSDLSAHRAAPTGVDLSGSVRKEPREGLTQASRINLNEITVPVELPIVICPTQSRHHTSLAIPNQKQNPGELGSCPGSPIHRASDPCNFQSSPLPEGNAPSLEGSFSPPGLNSEDAQAIVCKPPDPSIAVGPDHFVIAVNSAMQVYDRQGTPQHSVPIPLSTFFNNTSHCGGDLFDPKVLYDEEEGRFFLGADNDGKFYCFAVSAHNDPTQWCGYSFETATGNDFFDFPQAGVGDEHIFVGANIISSGSSIRGKIWSLEKQDMYACRRNIIMNTKDLGPDTSPQPVNFHRSANNSWPSGPHIFLTTRDFMRVRFLGVWKWLGGGSDPLSLAGQVDLDTFTQVKAGQPIPAPQQDSNSAYIRATDGRILDAEYRDGRAWFAQSISCDTTSGPKNAIRWGAIDATTAQIDQAGVVWSPDQHMIVPDLAVNKCGDITLGYTRSDGMSAPSVHFTNRLGIDPPNILRDEICCKTGDQDYSCTTTTNPGSPQRWGDYTSATSDPNGEGFWYLGLYPNNSIHPNGNWGFALCDISTGCEPKPLLFGDGFESGDTSAWSASEP